MSLQQKATTAVAAVCPIHGISFGKLDDKATWRINFKDEATADQRAAAEAALKIFDAGAAALAVGKQRQIERIEERHPGLTRGEREKLLIELRVCRALFSVPAIADAIRAEFGLAPGAPLPDLSKMPIFDRAAKAEAEIAPLR